MLITIQVSKDEIMRLREKFYNAPVKLETGLRLIELKAEFADLELDDWANEDKILFRVYEQGIMLNP